MWRVEGTHAQIPKGNWEDNVWTIKKYQWSDKIFKRNQIERSKNTKVEIKIN